MAWLLLSAQVRSLPRVVVREKIFASKSWLQKIKILNPYNHQLRGRRAVCETNMNAHKKKLQYFVIHFRP